MKKLRYYTLALLFVSMPFAKSYANNIGAQNIGSDWHVWGQYIFAKVDNIKIAIGKAVNEENEIIGYNIYADGTSRGALLCRIRCTDGNYLPKDLNTDNDLSYTDHNNDGLTDIGAPIRNGDMLWYIQTQNEQGNTVFVFSEKDKKQPTPFQAENPQ